MESGETWSGRLANGPPPRDRNGYPGMTHADIIKMVLVAIAYVAIALLSLHSAGQTRIEQTLRSTVSVAAKTLILFCNGAWCGQSPTNLRALMDLGYPAHKLKWYRGGMQAWEQLGFTTVNP